MPTLSNKTLSDTPQCPDQLDSSIKNLCNQLRDLIQEQLFRVTYTPLALEAQNGEIFVITTQGRQQLKDFISWLRTTNLPFRDRLRLEAQYNALVVRIVEKQKEAVDTFLENSYLNTTCRQIVWVEPFHRDVNVKYSCRIFRRYFYKINPNYYNLDTNVYRDSYVENNYKNSQGIVTTVKVTIDDGLETVLNNNPIPKGFTLCDNYVGHQPPKPLWIHPNTVTYCGELKKQIKTQKLRINENYEYFYAQSWVHPNTNNYIWGSLNGIGLTYVPLETKTTSNMEQIQKEIDLFPPSLIPSNHLFTDAQGVQRIAKEKYFKEKSIRANVTLEDHCGNKYHTTQWIADIVYVQTLGLTTKIEEFPLSTPDCSLIKNRPDDSECPGLYAISNAGRIKIDHRRAIKK